MTDTDDDFLAELREIFASMSKEQRQRGKRMLLTLIEALEPNTETPDVHP